MAVQAAGAEEPATHANGVGPDKPRREEPIVAGAPEVAVVPVEEDKQETPAEVSMFPG